MKILITGHRGFIGAKTYQAIQKMHVPLMAIDHKCSGQTLDRELTEKKTEVEILKFKPSVILHLAGQPNASICESHSSSGFRDNVRTTLGLIRVAERARVRRFIFASSAAAYFPSMSNYGRQKVICEKLLQRSKIPERISLRYFNVYGEGGRGVIDKWRKSQNPRMHGDGTQSRDFIHVSDVVRANVLATSIDNVSPSLTLDIGSGIATSLRDASKRFMIRNLTWEPCCKIGVASSVANTKPARLILSFAPETPLPDGDLH